MILTPVVLGFEVTDFNPNDEAIGLINERLEVLKPTSSLFIKRDISYAQLENLNLLVIVDIVLLFESGVMTRSVRDRKIKDFKQNLEEEFVQYFKSQSVMFKVLTVD